MSSFLMNNNNNNNNNNGTTPHKKQQEDEDDDDNNSKDKRRRWRRNPLLLLLSPRKIAMVCQNNNKQKYLRLLAIGLVLFWLIIGIVGLIAHLIPNNRVFKVLNSHPQDENLLEYECIGWHTTSGFYPFAIPRLWRFIQHSIFRQVSLPCNIKVPPDESGYCELRHISTGNPLYLLQQTYDGIKRQKPVLACVMAYQLLEFQKLLKNPPPIVSLPKLESSKKSPLDEILEKHDDQGNPKPKEPRRGILMYFQPQNQDEIISVYATISLLRSDYNCQLPIELWIHGGEDELRTSSIFSNPIWHMLLMSYDVTYRLVWDYQYQDDAVIPYSIVHTTKFDEVLVLGKVTSFPTQNPTFLFDTPQYKETGALFWKDLFSPQAGVKDTTIKDALWDTLEIPPSSPIRTEMEMDNGQFVINIKQSQKPLQLLMLMNQAPWFPLLKGLRILQQQSSNKDLYRLAWHLSNQQFSYVTTPPALLAAAASGSNNKKHKEEEEDSSCTQTLLQHSPELPSPEGSPIPLFVHYRGDFSSNFVTPLKKQESNDNSNNVILWDHGEYFKGAEDDAENKQQYALGSYWAEPEPKGNEELVDIDPTHPCYYIKKPKLFEQRSLQQIGGATSNNNNNGNNNNLVQLEEKVRMYVEQAVVLRGETNKKATTK